MKKIGFIGAIIPIFFLFASCGEESTAKSKPVLVFSSKVCIAVSDQFIEGNLARSENGEIQLEVTSPDQVGGLTFKRAGGENTIQFKDLAMKSKESLLPKGSFITVLMDVLECMENENNYNFILSENALSTFSGYNEKIGDFEFQIYDSSGYIKEIKVPKKNVLVNLSEHEENV